MEKESRENHYGYNIGPIELNDPVNHPSHYTSGSIECIDAMIGAFGEKVVADFCLCNAFKYFWRHQKKNGIEDIRKASWYLAEYEKLLTCKTLNKK